MFSKKGFTLIELLIVIGIIAILAAALIVGLNPAERFKQARNATRWSHLNTISSSIMAYVVDEQGNYPEDCFSSEDVVASTPPGSEDGDTIAGTCATEIGITAPDDPQDGEDYMIAWYEEEGGQFIIWSTAEEALEEEIWIIQ